MIIDYETQSKIDRVHGIIRLLDGFIFDSLTNQPEPEDVETTIEGWVMLAEAWEALKDELNKYKEE